jgi:hypothetical protein
VVLEAPSQDSLGALPWDREERPCSPSPWKKSYPQDQLFSLLRFSFNRRMTVTLGAHNVRKRECTQQKIKVEKYILPPNYNVSSKFNDIVLLKVSLFFLPISSLPSLTLLLAQTFKFSLVQSISLELNC